MLHNLLDVVEEVELALMELRNLTHSRFSQPSGNCSCMFSFISKFGFCSFGARENNIV